MKKIVVSSLVSLFVLSCSVTVPNNSTQKGRMPHRDFRWSQFAPTGQPSLVRDTSSPSPQTPLLGGAGVGSLHPSLIKYNFAELEKEYKSFSTKALSDAYVKRMFGKYLVISPNSSQLIRQIEFSRYLKNNADSSYETSLKNMFTQTPALFATLTGSSFPDIQNKMSTESASFGSFVNGLSPGPGTPVANSASNITQNSFRAGWSTVSDATGYKIIIDNGSPIDAGTNTYYDVTGLTAGSTHSYYVQAYNAGGNTSNSNTVDVSLLTGISCKALKDNGASTSGTYYIGPSLVKVYCDMITDGGGWTLVAAQYESSPVQWNAGVSGNYSFSAGFALSSSQLPPDRTYVGFSKDFTANGIDYVSYVYTAGNISPSVRLLGAKTANYYDLYRAGINYDYHDPERGNSGGVIPAWADTLTFDEANKSPGLTWAFCPNTGTTTYRGYNYNGNLSGSSETFPWTVWVK